MSVMNVTLCRWIFCIAHEQAIKTYLNTFLIIQMYAFFPFFVFSWISLAVFLGMHNILATLLLSANIGFKIKYRPISDDMITYKILGCCFLAAMFHMFSVDRCHVYSLCPL